MIRTIAIIAAPGYGCRYAAHGRINMNARPTLVILILATACTIACDNRPDDAPTTQPNFSPPKPTVRTLAPIEGSQALTEDTLQAFEQNYSCRLPDDYRRFLLGNNGGFPSPDCIRFAEAGLMTVSDVFCFFAIADNRAWASVEWHLDTYSHRLPEDTIPIARDSCGNLWLIGVGSDNAGIVFFWDHGSFDTFDETDLDNWPRVATSFTEFQDKLTSYDPYDENNVVPSRYALVKQATDATARNSPGFSPRENPDFVWHCDCDDDGNVRMQLVQYEAHAIATHTDGYSRLRGIKGVIQEGPTRLPR